MSDYTYSAEDYAMFSNGSATAKSMVESLNTLKTDVEACKTIIENQSIYLGPAADKCKSLVDTINTTTDTYISSFTNVANYLISAAEAYKSGDSSALTTLNEALTSGKEIAAPTASGGTSADGGQTATGSGKENSSEPPADSSKSTGEKKDDEKTDKGKDSETPEDNNGQSKADGIGKEPEAQTNGGKTNIETGKGATGKETNTETGKGAAGATDTETGDGATGKEINTATGERTGGATDTETGDGATGNPSETTSTETGDGATGNPSETTSTETGKGAAGATTTAQVYRT